MKSVRIFVFSDTHGDTSGMELVLSKSWTKPDAIIHCGDGAWDALEIARKFPEAAVHVVRGNVDADLPNLPEEQCLKIAGRKIYFAHGDKFNVHGESVTGANANSEIVTRAKELGAEIVLHGHTHLATLSLERGVYLLNPGSASLKQPYDFKPSFGCVEIFEGHVVCKILSVAVFGKLGVA